MTDAPAAAPSVSVAIPFYSNVGYLDRALRSLIAQTDPDWTAVVVDDASTEAGAEELVAALGDPRVRYLRNERNLGVAGNFNKCLDVGGVHADVVTVLHADDELEPGYITAVRRAHTAFPRATCVAPRVTVVDATGTPTHTLPDSVKSMLWPRALPTTLVGDAGLARVMRGLFFYCPSVSYRAALLPQVRFDERWQQVMDLDLYARILLGEGSIALIPDRVYRYRRHPGTMTAQNSRSLVRLAEEVSVSRDVAVSAREKGWTRSARAARLRLTVRLNGLLEAGKLLARRDMRAAATAFRAALGR
jgi:glycosyltransferase involved in cell wall biosynthesis